MKSFKYVSLVLALFFMFFWVSLAWNVSEENKAKMDNLMSVVEKQWWKESPINQISKYEKVLNSFEKAAYKNDEQKEMIQYLLSLFREKVNSLKKSVMSQSELIVNVDRNKVEEAWLSWHNASRSAVWLTPYKINKTLNYSALVRANNLAITNRKSSTHWRTIWDGYYSYEGIKYWFENLWITFNYAGTAFSESNAYQYYTCKKSDCTNEMIAALQKAYNFLENEKKSHYPAIVSKYYDQLWFWVAVNWNNVRVTTHYAINVN